MKLKWVVLMAIGLIFLSLACIGENISQTPTPRPTFPPDPTLASANFDNVCDYEYVAITGKILVSGFQTHQDYYDLSLSNSIDSGGSNDLKYLDLTIPVGVSPNHIEELPSQFKVGDVRIHTDGDEIISNGTTVILTGSIAKSSGTPYANHLSCHMSVGKIEIPVGPLTTPTPLFTATPVTTTFENVCTSKARRVTVQGRFSSLSSSTLCSSTSCILYFEGVKGQGPKILIAGIHLGHGNNQMEPLPESYSDSDLKIHSVEGKIVGVGDEVLLTGWSSFGPSGGCTLDVELISLP